MEQVHVKIIIQVDILISRYTFNDITVDASLLIYSVLIWNANRDVFKGNSKAFTLFYIEYKISYRYYIIL